MSSKITKYIIDFVHKGKDVEFRAELNPLSGDWLYTWDNWYGCFVAESKRDINTMIKNIKKKCVINRIEEL